MTKKDLEFLQSEANKALTDVENAIKNLTKDKPLILFTIEDTEEDDFCDNVYDYPYGYTVSKHGFYMQGAIQKIEGDDVKLFLTGEDWGELHDLKLSELPFESLISVLTNLIERE